MTGINLGANAWMVVSGIIIAVITYLIEKYVTEEPTKPGKLAYLVATVLVVVWAILFLVTNFS